jgi:small-conductance mechanosensitive channel
MATLQMTTVNNDIKYAMKFLQKIASVVFLVLLLALAISYFFGSQALVSGLMSGILGYIGASLNLFSIAFASKQMMMESRGGYSVIVWPVLSFITLCIITGIFSIYFLELALFFALGLCAPLVIGIFFAFTAKRS